MKKIATCYWNNGGFYFESDPMTRFATEASMFRKADAMGFTHVLCQHGVYKTGEGFVTNPHIPTTRAKRIPKKYRRRNINNENNE